MKNVVLLVIFLFFATLSGVSFAQDGEEVIVEGMVKEIAEDGSYIIVDETKILTTPEIVEEAFFELNDSVIITVEKTKEGLSLVDYEYAFSYDPDEEQGENEIETPEDLPYEPDRLQE